MRIIILLNRIGNAVYLPVRMIKNHMHDKAINIHFFYVITCVLDTHLRVGFLGSFVLIKFVMVLSAGIFSLKDKVEI